ncbi:MAG TPA: FAD-binding domain [Steroidobacteraceae bacterium]|jgi:2-polyprenyl-6-methoxyphenol hydroxylase-like FAD-dependent oxidoreductase
MKVLISGAGIAGTCLAFWLRRHGFAPTLVERAPGLRSGGYIIDFWGAGFEIAERMGLASQIQDRGYKVRELRQVDRAGKRIVGLSVGVLDRMMAGRYSSLPRSELAACLHQALAPEVVTLFDDGIVRLDARGPAVQVEFQHAASRAFDLVIGADGLHSAVRGLVFGPDRIFERYLKIKVAAFTVEGYRPRDELVYLMHREIGRQVARFSMRDDRTMFLLVFADEDPSIPVGLMDQKALLHRHFRNCGWECAHILELLADQRELYLDRVSQVHMDHWHAGRAALVGDAAFCVSLLGGQGCALAMVAAYVLAGELKRAGGEHELAFARYEQRLRPFMAAKQRAALRFASFFAPASRWSLALGNFALRLATIPVVSALALGRQFQDRLELPEY